MSKNFRELIEEYQIVIPLIQRDYAQGREEEKEKARNFLEAILEGTQSELNLDFIYGKVDEKDKIFIPLDGQQRLTTLLLLHWFISLEEEYYGDLTKFSYEVRSSTKDFIKELMKEINWKKLKKENIRNQIECSNWFFLSWKRDPTVKSILNILDLIETKFQETKLEELDNVTFEFLNLNDFELTDELYVKMNARGKPLTEFENFKSKFERYIIDEKVKAKLDNDWLNIFWNTAKNEVDNIVDAPKLADEKFYNFFYNMTLNFYLENQTKAICKTQEFKSLTDKKKQNGFIDECSIFDFYQDVYEDKNYVNEIILILDNLQKTEEFKKFISSKKDISYWDRARFYSLSLGYINRLNEVEFTRWRRVSFNLINNQLIQSLEDLIKTLKSLRKLIENSKSDIYSYIKDSKDNIDYFLQEQRAEESLKARLILENDKWENEIIKAEENWYLDGQIGFLLRYANNNFDEFINYRDRFIYLWEFSKENKENKILIYQALLTKGNYLPKAWRNRTFCSFEPALRPKMDNWRKVFNAENKYFKELLDDDNFNINNIQISLKNIIDLWGNEYKNDCSNEELRFRFTLLKYIDYCEKLDIRFERYDSVYLLKKTQMNGTHAELYTWDLFNKKFGLKNTQDRLKWWRLESDKNFEPFQVAYYYETTSASSPFIVLDDWRDIEVNISYEDKKFCIAFCRYDYEKKEYKDIPNDIISVLEAKKFISNEKHKKEYLYFFKACEEDELMGFLEELLEDFSRD
jgi:hypothetical protein